MSGSHSPGSDDAARESSGVGEGTGETEIYSQAYSAPESEQFTSGPYVPADVALYDGGEEGAIAMERLDAIQRELSELERKQRRLRQEIFAVEDEIIAKRDELIASLQQRLQEKTSNETLFSVRWQVT